MRGENSLDTIDLGTSISSNEGLDVNYASRIRIQYLTAQSTVLVTQTQFADAKAAALMTLSGLLMFRGPAGFSQSLLADPFLITSLLLNIGCLVACITALIPRVRREAQTPGHYASERFSWLALSHPTTPAEAYPDFVRSAEVSQLVLSQARANQASARVLRQKFTVLRFAFLLGICSIFAIGLQWIFAILAPQI